MDLTSEQEKCLLMLIDMETSSDSFGKDVYGLVYTALPIEENELGSDGFPPVERYIHNTRLERIILDLIKAGALIGSVDHTGTRLYRVDHLTSLGRCYFIDKEAAEKAARKRKWSDRRWQVIIAIITVVLGAVAGYIAGHIQQDNIPPATPPAATANNQTIVGINAFFHEQR